MGYEIKGFDAYLISDVLKGSGLSSSAAFEVILGVIMNGLFCKGQIDAVKLLQIGQYAENVFWKAKRTDGPSRFICWGNSSN